MQIILNNKKKMKRVIRTHHTIIVLAHSSIMIATRFRDQASLFVDRDLIFLSQISTHFEKEEDILFHIVDANMCAIQINNATNKSIIIVRNCRFDIVQKYEKKECYVAFAKHDYLVANSDID